MSDQEITTLYRQLAALAKKKVVSEVILLTPDMAEGWLAKNAINRPLGLATVNRYVAYIRKGQWMLNGQPVILAEDETLLDGQHRLKAIVKSGVGVPMLVVWGVDKEAFKTLDQGKVRSAADTLATMSEKRAKALASALGWLNRYITSAMTYRGPRMSNIEYVKILEEHPGMRDSLEWVYPKCQKGMHPVGPFAFLHYVCMDRHPDRANFFEKVLTGANLEKGSAEHVLDRRLVALKDSVTGKTQAQMIELLAVCIKAWNASLSGNSIKLLRWSPSEDFPEII